MTQEEIQNEINRIKESETNTPINENICNFLRLHEEYASECDSLENDGWPKLDSIALLKKVEI